MCSIWISPPFVQYSRSLWLTALIPLRSQLIFLQLLSMLMPSPMRPMGPPLVRRLPPLQLQSMLPLHPLLQTPTTERLLLDNLMRAIHLLMPAWRLILMLPKHLKMARRPPCPPTWPELATALPMPLHHRSRALLQTAPFRRPTAQTPRLIGPPSIMMTPNYTTRGTNPLRTKLMTREPMLQLATAQPMTLHHRSRALLTPAQPMTLHHRSKARVGLVWAKARLSLVRAKARLSLVQPHITFVQLGKLLPHLQCCLPQLLRHRLQS